MSIANKLKELNQIKHWIACLDWRGKRNDRQRKD